MKMPRSGECPTEHARLQPVGGVKSGCRTGRARPSRTRERSLAFAAGARYGRRVRGAIVAAIVTVAAIVAFAGGVARADIYSYEDKEGRWHEELARGDDRPETDVEG